MTALDHLQWWSHLLVIPAFASSPIPYVSKLCFLDKPVLNKPFRLAYKFKFLYVQRDVRARIELSPSIQLVSGQLDWQGSLGAQQEQTVEVSAKATSVGYYSIAASAGTAGFESGPSTSSDLAISATDSAVGNNYSPMNQWFASAASYQDYTDRRPSSDPKLNPKIRSEVVVSNPPKLNGEFTLTYRITPAIDLPDNPRHRPRLILLFPPDGFQVVRFDHPTAGDLQEMPFELKWYGEMHKDQPYEVRVTLKVLRPGWGILYGWLFALNDDPANNNEDIRIIRMYADETAGTFTEVN